MITDEQVKLTLSALGFPNNIADEVVVKGMHDALEAYEASKPKPVPVGFWDGKYCKHGTAVVYKVRQDCKFLSCPNIPLYALPPQRKSLNEDMIRRLWHTNYKTGLTLNEFKIIVEAIEKAHGIGV